MQNRNRLLIAGALCSALALFSSAKVHAEGDAGLDEADMDRFQAYVVQMARPSHTMSSDLAVGAQLPAQGMTYYEIPAEYRVSPQLRYTVVNGRAVLVDSRTGRVIQMMR
jgi:hypothetical protein